MQLKGYKIDDQGFYTEDYIYKENQDLEPNIIKTDIQKGLYKPKWDGEKWVEGAIVDVEKIKQSKINEIEEWCRTAIISGFKSSAYQGIEKTYASTLEDQANITGNALSATSKIAGVTECQNDKFYYHAIGEDFVEFTAGECLQLARDWKSFKETQLFKSKELQNFVNSLTTKEDINEVTSFDFVIPTA
jgi:hypothetical protein